MGIYTEKNARTKWCPMSRTYDVGRQVSGYNVAEPNYMMHDHDLRQSTRCQGSECMLWQWQDNEYEYADSIGKPAGDGWEVNPGAQLSRWRRLRGEKRLGFCGLARSV